MIACMYVCDCLTVCCQWHNVMLKSAWFTELQQCFLLQMDFFLGCGNAHRFSTYCSEYLQVIQ